MAITPKKRKFDYTEKQIEQVNFIRAFMDKNNFTQTAMAKLSRLKDGTFSSVLSEKYPTDPTGHLAKVLMAIENYDPKKTHVLSSHVETSVFKIVQTACQMARRNRNFAIVAAYVGLGKTFSAKMYSKNDPNVYLIEADPAMNANTLTRLLIRQLQIVDCRTVSERYEAIIEELKGTDSLIIIDEAETISPKALHLIRRIRDKAGVGILLLGTEYLTGLIAPEHGQFDQIRSRVGFWPQTIQTATFADCEAICKGRLTDVDDATIQRLWAYSKGSMRMLAEGLITAIETYRKDQALTPDLVDAIAQQALTLKLLPKGVTK